MGGDFSIHRKRPGQSEDRMIFSGSKEEMLRQFANLPESTRSQYFMMQGGMEWNHLEVDNMLRNEAAQNPTDGDY